MSNKFNKLLENAPTTNRSEPTLAPGKPLNAANLPLSFEYDGDIDLPSWIANHRAELRAKLHEHGAILFRSQTGASFEDVVRAFSPSPVDYRGGAAVRSRVSDTTYTASEYPAQLVIRQHSEFC